MFKKIVVIFLIIICLGACTTSSVLVNIQTSTDIILPEDIQNIVVVNRSCSFKDSLLGEITDELISREEVSADRKGAEYCVEELINMLTSSERFTLKNESVIELKGKGVSGFPIPLDWNEVISICGSYDGDAIFALEIFDFDSRTTVGNPVTRVKKIKGVKVKEIRYPATLIMEMESGWRIYDVHNKKIVDENRFTEVKEFSAYGSSADNAIRNLPSKRNAIKQSGIFAGKQYGFRISPIWIKVRKTYFTGKHHDLKLAKSYVKSGDWDAAIEIWKDLANNSDDKTIRRSAYNMAIASEIKGELDTAIEWANKAQKLGEKKAYRYINVLHIRKTNEEKLRHQLNN